MVRCTSRVLHVVPMMSYIFSYCVLLLYSLVGLIVCGCRQIIQIYVCKMMGGDEVLIYGVDLDLLLLDVVICPTI